MLELGLSLNVLSFKLAERSGQPQHQKVKSKEMGNGCGWTPDPFHLSHL